MHDRKRLSACESRGRIVLPEAKRRFDTPLSAFLTVLRDKGDTANKIEPSPPSDRLDGKTCLVTGANSGLGYAIAVALSRRGAKLILATRSVDAGLVDKIKTETGNPSIENFQVDLADLQSVEALVARIASTTDHIDRLILNAGLMASKANVTPQGYEEMFAVHYLANYQLITGLAKRGLLDRAADGATPRVIAISSEAHRSGLPIDPDSFGKVQPHTFRTALKQYGHTKLAMSLMISGLSDEFKDETGTPTLSFFQSSPGPVATRIARSAPLLLRPFSWLLLPLLFSSPEQAAGPAIYLACSPEMDGKTNLYMHMMRIKQPAASAEDADSKAFVLAFAKAAY